MDDFKVRLRILVVEDNQMSRDLVERQLRRIGCVNVHCVENGRKALDWIQQHPCDVIFTDCQMPVMDGYEMTSRIRSEMSREMPRHYIVALSASALNTERQRCFSVGMDAHLSKPTQMADILTVLQQASQALG